MWIIIIVDGRDQSQCESFELCTFTDIRFTFAVNGSCPVNGKI